MAVAFGNSGGNEASLRLIIVSLFYLSIEPAALLLLFRERFRWQWHSKLSASVHCRIILQRAGRLQNRLPRLPAPFAQFVFAGRCSSGCLKQLLQACSSRSRHRNDFLVTMREATPLSLQRLQCRPWKLRYANLNGAGEVIFSKGLPMWKFVALSLLAYKGFHATQFGVHEIVQ